MGNAGYQVARLPDLLEQRGPGFHYAEFMRGDFASAGVAVWPAGSDDTQRPHAEDEVYYCIAGRAKLRMGDEVIAVEPGTAVYVTREVEHRFEDIQEELQVLVFWGPPHRSLEGRR